MTHLSVRSTARTQLVDVTSLVGEAIVATAVAEDVAAALDRLVDECGPWGHDREGDRNPWSHVRASLTASSVGIPLFDGALALGEHQAIFLAEFDGPRDRTLLVTVT